MAPSRAPIWPRISRATVSLTTVHRLPREGQEVGEVLRRAAIDLDADLIVMGGYGHSRLRERFFGGATTFMMKQATIPVLMAH